MIDRAAASAVGRVVAVLLIAAGTAGAMAACSSSAPAKQPTSTAAPSTSDKPLPPAPTSSQPTQPSAPPPVTATEEPSTSAPPSSSASSSAAPQSTCTNVTVRVIRGSADVGREIAALQFTNAGSKPCVLYGYPQATLLRNGSAFGTPAQPSSNKASQRALAPGDTAESLLNDFTDCEAPLSDEIKVTVPGSTQTATRPAQLRGCTLRVSALHAPQ